MFIIDQNIKYGIMLSGGLDSAVLFALLLKEKIEVQPFVIPKFDGSEIHSVNVVKFFRDTLNLNISDPIKVGDPTLFHRDMSRSAVLEIFEKYSDRCHVLFNALNKVHPSLEDEHSPKRETSEYEKIKFPFLHLYKTDIVQMMFDNQLEPLMKITHTCTESTGKRCGKCWQCRERMWAFEQLGRKDEGEL